MLDDGGTIGDLLPLLTPREVWAIGMVVVLAVLRPVQRLGWAVAGVIMVGGGATMAVWAFDGLDPGLWQLVPWAVLAGLLGATAAGSPLRWEPRTGPSAATALLAGALVLHAGAAWHGRGGVLARAADDWTAGALDLGADVAGPLALPPLWALSRVPGIDAVDAVAIASVGAVGLIVWGAALLASHWGYTGTARGTAAAVAWAPPLLIAYDVAPGALLAAAALVWSWWALGEVWAGRHLPDRMAALSGTLLGVAVGIGLWPVVVAPLWLRRLGGRKLGWFVVGFVGALVLAVGALLPNAVGLGDLWRAAVVDPSDVLGLSPWWAVVVGVAALVPGLRRVPFSPTRLSAVTGAVLVVTLPWWPAGWQLAGPVVATPFILLAAVAPDRPEEHWPPDAPLPEEQVPAGAAP